MSQEQSNTIKNMKARMMEEVRRGANGNGSLAHFDQDVRASDVRPTLGVHEQVNYPTSRGNTPEYGTLRPVIHESVGHDKTPTRVNLSEVEAPYYFPEKIVTHTLDVLASLTSESAAFDRVTAILQNPHAVEVRKDGIVDLIAFSTKEMSGHFLTSEEKLSRLLYDKIQVNVSDLRPEIYDNRIDSGELRYKFAVARVPNGLLNLVSRSAVRELVLSLLVK